MGQVHEESVPLYAALFLRQIVGETPTLCGGLKKKNLMHVC
jgi:hypothetical protein